MPVDWPEVTVGEVCSQIIDCVNKTAPTVPGPTAFKMVRTTNVRGGWVDTESVKFVDEEVFKIWTRRGEPRPGDVILTREAPLGEVGMLRQAEPVFLGQRLVMYRADPARLDNRFLLYAMLDSFVQDQVSSLGSGATVEHMRVPDCERLRLRLPPLPTQRRIGSVLFAYDELIENNGRRIQLLEEMAGAIYREWFVEFRYPGYADVQLVDSDLGPIPEGWRAETLGTFVQMHRKNVAPTTLVAEIFAHFSIPSFDASCLPVIENGASIKSLKYELPGPCVLYSKLNPRIPRVWLATPDPQYRSIASTEFIVLTPLAGWCLSMIFSLCSSVEFADQVTGMAGGTSTSHQRAKPQELLAMQVPNPPSELLVLFDGVVGPMLDLAQQLRWTNENVRDTRDLLLPRLISGEVDVSDLDIDGGDTVP